ncbi:hypothetical protein WJX81_000616 [Elliptochloris bilobata]|uniref:Uncharacterized protein n=1 Tax=Elliptochloris bilobata TaxID=381761 RepID=A0AAW1SIC4_9CHLO
MLAGRRGSDRMLRSPARFAALTERVGLPEILATLAADGGRAGRSGRQGVRAAGDWAVEHGVLRAAGAASAGGQQAQEAGFAASAAASAAAGAARAQARPQQLGPCAKRKYSAWVAMPKVGGRWASGLPYLNGAVKRIDGMLLASGWSYASWMSMHPRGQCLRRAMQCGQRQRRRGAMR